MRKLLPLQLPQVPLDEMLLAFSFHKNLKVISNEGIRVSQLSTSFGATGGSRSLLTRPRPFPQALAVLNLLISASNRPSGLRSSISRRDLSKHLGNFLNLAPFAISDFATRGFSVKSESSESESTI